MASSPDFDTQMYAGRILVCDARGFAMTWGELCDACLAELDDMHLWRRMQGWYESHRQRGSFADRDRHKVPK